MDLGLFVQNRVGLDRRARSRTIQSQLPTSLRGGSSRRRGLRNSPRARGWGKRVRRVITGPAAAARPGARRARWSDGANRPELHGSRLATGSPDFASLAGDPSLPCCGGGRGRERPRRRLRASSARHGRDKVRSQNFRNHSPESSPYCGS